MTLAHVGDVLMAGTYGGGLEINVPVENRKAIGEMRCRLVLLGLAYHANKESLAWPSARTLGEELKIPESKVRVALRVLEEDGWIRQVAGYRPGKRGTTYLLILPSFTDPNNSVDANGPHLVTQLVAQEDPQVFAQEDPQRSTQLGTPACDKEEVKVKHKDKYETETLRSEKVSKIDLGFMEFWRAYPKCVDHGRTQNTWKIAITKAPQDMIISAAERYAVEVADTDEQYIAHPANWLFQERWTDEYEE